MLFRSPETAAASALTGHITDPTTLDIELEIDTPEFFDIDDRMILKPASVDEYDEVKVLRGPNIKSLPIADNLPDSLEAKVLLKVGDNITTDHIMPAGAKILPYRSNIPHLSKFCFYQVDPEFSQRALEAGKGFIIAGANYGQGSSREHAALVPLYLNIKAVIAISFARIHRSNLINVGILPLTFEDPSDYEKIELGDLLELTNLDKNLGNEDNLALSNKTKSISIPLKGGFSDRELGMLKVGGLLNYTKIKEV